MVDEMEVMRRVKRSESVYSQSGFWVLTIVNKQVLSSQLLLIGSGTGSLSPSQIRNPTNGEPLTCLARDDNRARGDPQLCQRNRWWCGVGERWPPLPLLVSTASSFTELYWQMRWCACFSSEFPPPPLPSSIISMSPPPFDQEPGLCWHEI